MQPNPLSPLKSRSPFGVFCSSLLAGDSFQGQSPASRLLHGNQLHRYDLVVLVAAPQTAIPTVVLQLREEIEATLHSLLHGERRVTTAAEKCEPPGRSGGFPDKKKEHRGDDAADAVFRRNEKLQATRLSGGLLRRCAGRLE